MARHRLLLFTVFLTIGIGGCAATTPQARDAERASRDVTPYKVGSDFPIATRATREEKPAIAWDGTNYLVVWQDQRAETFDIYASRISADGQILDPDNIPISTMENDQLRPAMTWNGDVYFVVWQDRRGSQEWAIYGSRVTPGGVVLDPDGILISAGPQKRSTPSIAWGGGRFLVAWEQTHPAPRKYDLYGARLSADGTVLDPEGIPISNGEEDQYYSGISWNGEHFLVVWSDQRSGTSFDIYGTRIDADGTRLDPEGFPISQAPDDQFYPTVNWNGSVHLVAWMDRRQGEVTIWGARVTPAADVLDEQGLAIATSPTFHATPYLLARGEEFLAVWEEQQKKTIKDIFGARIGAEGRVFEPARIAVYRGMKHQSRARAASDGARYLVIWNDEREGIPYQGDIYGQFLDFSSP